MIVTEFYMTRDDGVDLERTYSDRGFIIENTVTGELFSEVVNPVNSGRTYIETNERDFPDDDITAEEALAIITGGEI